MQELNKLETLRDIIDKGEYIVALCGSGMMEECGIHPLKDQDRAYRIEERYGRSPEYLYTDAFFNTRTETFYDFYRNELLVDLEPTASTYTLAAMERAGKLKCIISSNIYELSGAAATMSSIFTEVFIRTIARNAAKSIPLTTSDRRGRFHTVRRAAE